MIGERWSVRSQKLRDLFARHQAPAGLYDAASGQGRQMLDELGLASPELPVVALRFAAEPSALVNPSNRLWGSRTRPWVLTWASTQPVRIR